MANVLEEYVEELSELLQNAKGKKIDIVAEVYDLIISQKDSVKAFQFFLENADDVESTEAWNVPQRISDEELQKIEGRCEQLVVGIITNLITQGYDRETFYNKLWNMIQSNPLWNMEEEKIYALYRLWKDDKIPYFQLEPGLQMSNERFREISDARKVEIQKVFYVMSAPMQQKTERTSLILKILKACENEEEKAVVLAQVLAYVERKTATEIFDFINKGAQTEE